MYFRRFLFNRLIGNFYRPSDCLGVLELLIGALSRGHLVIGFDNSLGLRNKNGKWIACI